MCLFPKGLTPWLQNHPGPDKSIRKKDLESGKIISRRYRNRRIGEFLKELKLTEGRSTGIPKIFKALKENGSPAPIIATDEDRTYFLIEIKIHELFLGQEEAQEEVQEEAQDKKELSEIEERILEFISNDEVSKEEIADYLKIKKTSGNFKKAMKKLKEKGYIEYIIPEKPTSKYQKYRISKKN
ncbi:MAG TPA: ATP-binding protein [Thermotogota bacterium]|nr:ATP-binding protein [Thermotogota bacterium]